MRATFTFWVRQKFIKNAKMVHFSELFDKLKLAVKQCYQTGQLGGKFQNSKLQLRHFWVIFKHCDLRLLRLRNSVTRQVNFNRTNIVKIAKIQMWFFEWFSNILQKILKLVGTPCMTFLSILTQVSFKGQFWLSFDDTDFLCPHPNISFEAKNHPKNLPNFFVPFCQAEPFFCRRYQEEIFFSLGC